MHRINATRGRRAIRGAVRVILLDGDGGAKSFVTYAQWVDDRARRMAIASALPRTASPPERRKKVRIAPEKLTYNEQREFEGMEDAILEAEAEAGRFEAEAAELALTSDHERATEVYQHLAAAQQRVKALYERWAVLESKQG